MVKNKLKINRWPPLKSRRENKKNFEFLTSVIGRIERELHTSLLTIQPNFKQSALKCSTTAILLRFV